MSRNSEQDKKKKKKREKDMESWIFSLMKKSLDAALKATMDDLFKDFK